MKGILFDSTTVNLVPLSLVVTGTWKDRNPNGVPVAYDTNLIKFIYNQLKDIENPILLDVGASVGSFALLGVALPKLWVTAFEPNPEAARILGRNVQLNGLENRVKIMTCALLDREGAAMLKLPAEPEKAGLACVGKPTRFVTYREVKVEARRLDALDIGPAHIIKIDAEGAELPILKGGQQYIQSCHPALLVEYYAPNTKAFGYEPTAIKELLAGWGYASRRQGKEDLWAYPKK